MADYTTPFRLVDTHCHLDLFPSADELIGEIEAENICTIAVTNAPFLFANTQALAERSSLILPALGLHPELVLSHGNQLGQFSELLPKTKYIGEIGLDYVTNDVQNRDAQRQVFESIVGWCDEAGDKVLTVHSRRSAPDILAILGESFTGTVILHWYSGSLRDLRKAISAGFYFSINVAMVRSERGQRLIREIPANRLLTETDGPFAKHEGQPATPATITCVIDALASLRQMSVEDARVLIHSNAKIALMLT